MRISPPETSSSPAIIRSVVDLPHPEGPTSTVNSPSSILRSSPRMTSAPSYSLRRSHSSMTGMVAIVSPSGP